MSGVRSLSTRSGCETAYEAFAISPIATMRVEGCSIPAITRCEQPITGELLPVGLASKLAQQAIR